MKTFIAKSDESIFAVLCKNNFFTVAFVTFCREGHDSILNNLVYMAFLAKIIKSVCRVCTCVHYVSDNSIFFYFGVYRVLVPTLQI